MCSNMEDIAQVKLIMQKEIDILIIGAGISGIGLASHLSKECPKRSFKIVEQRQNIGGTWDLFKYPGIRSDSDMSTFGFNFKPWTKASVLADGTSIKSYLSEVVTEQQLEKHIYFNHRILSLNFNSSKKKWVVEIENAQHQMEVWVANFVCGCTGYYNYNQGFQPIFPQQEVFKGELIHPQHWPENLDYKNKKITIIGSGATAITLVPALVKGGAKNVTLLQRSPTYIASVPSVDKFYKKIQNILPLKMTYQLTRARNVGMQRLVYVLAQKQPQLLRKYLLSSIKKQLQGKVDIKHFTPTYNPWEQRLCVVPDGDLFQVLRDGQASIETDLIEKFTTSGILLKSGKTIEADIIVSATGLEIQILGGIKTTIDGVALDTSKTMLYRGVMVSDVPNMAMMIGYVNASWTLKVDIASKYICRLLNYMDQNNYKGVVAQGDINEMLDDTVMGSLSSGYISRAMDVLPKQGKSKIWQVTNNYLADRKALKAAKFKDDILKFH